MRFKKKLHTALLILLLSFNPTIIHAEESGSGSGSSGGENAPNSTTGGAVQTIGGLSAEALAGKSLEEAVQILQGECPDEKNYENAAAGRPFQCKSAWGAYRAMIADQNTIPAWGAVAGVCGAVCITSMVMPLASAVPGICATAAIGGAAYDYSESQKFMDAMTGGGMGLMGAYTVMNTRSKEAADATRLQAEQDLIDQDKTLNDEEKTNAKNTKNTAAQDLAKQNSTFKNRLEKTACATAAVAGYLMTEKEKNITKQRTALNTNLSQAMGLQGVSTATVAISTAKNAILSTLPDVTAHKAASTAAPEPLQIGACGQVANRSGGTQAQLTCATESDPTLPQGINHSNFPQVFKDTTKKDLGSFMNAAANNPNGAVAAAIESGVPGLKGGPLLTALDNMGNTTPMLSSKYSSGGSGGNTGGGGGPADGGIADMMNAMMGALGKKATDPDAGVKSVIFANQERSPASIVEDKTLNIFDRVTYRYYYVTKDYIYAP